MDTPQILIAGGGIGGLATALTLHQLGIPSVVLEAVREMRPLGVGINLQPNAVRELFDLGISRAQLDAIGVPIQEWALVGLNGKEIYSEQRGEAAGYHWPQYAVHRGKFHMLLYDTLIHRAGPSAVQLDRRVCRYQHAQEGVVATWQSRGGQTGTISGTLLIGADGIHSAIRAQMYPDQPAVNWGGALMWRGTTRAKPPRGTASFLGLGTHEKRMVIYPISAPDPDTGLSDINWIAEVTLDSREGWHKDRWFDQVPLSSFAHHFSDWTYPWLHVPSLLAGTSQAFENPMIDRDPIPTWQDGPVALLGDAAHAMYPTGSNGATQALIDARVLGACLQTNGVSQSALARYNAQLCGPVSELILRNRNDGPFGLLRLVDDRCGGVFEDIETIVPAAERAAYMRAYKEAAGFAKHQLNDAEATLKAV